MTMDVRRRQTKEKRDMKKDQWRQSLEKLLGDLGSADCVDEGSKERIDGLVKQIEQILDEPGDSSGEGHHGLLESIREHAGHFEVSHPTLTGTMNGVVSLLSGMGI